MYKKEFVKSEEHLLSQELVELFGIYCIC